MRRKSLAIVLVSLVFASQAAGQAFGNKFKKVDLGMTRAEVVELLGRPDGVRAHENEEALTYADRLVSGFKWSRADYVVVFRDGEVVEYGPGAIRDASPNTGAFVFVPL